MDRKLVRITFAAIAINFFLWNVLTPAFEPADESGHYAHILYIWKQGRLPNLVEPVPTEKGVGYTTYSPLYYWSLIPLAKLIDAPLESEELLPYHPQKELFKKSVFSVYLHTKDELFFKWNRLILAVHLLRLQTSVYGLLTVYLVYLTGKKIFGDKSLKPLSAAALVGLNPMFAHIFNSIVNVNLGILLFSLFFYLAVRSFANFSLTRLPRPAAAGLAMTGNVKLGWFNFILGFLTGLAYLTKITGLVLIPIWLIMTLTAAKILLKSLPDRAWFLVKSLGLFLVGFLVAAGWYLARNLNLYGSLLETGAAIKHFGRPAAQLEISGPINYWIGFIQTNFKTAFSGYGMVTVNLPDTIIYLLAVVAAISIWGVLISLKRDDPQRSILEGSSLIILLGHILVNIKVEAFHARDLFVGIIPFSLLFVLGAEAWWKKFKTGQFWDYKLINLLMIGLIYILTIFHFQQQAVVYVIKSALEGRQIGLAPVLSIAAVTVIFVLTWRFFLRFHEFRNSRFSQTSVIARSVSDLPRRQAGEAIPMRLLRPFGARNDGNHETRGFLGLVANDGGRMVWGLTAGLFAVNLAILFILVVPHLYRL